MELIDTHCHLTQLSEGELSGVIERARARGVVQMVCIGAGDGIESARRAIALTEHHPEIFVTVGVHPQDAGKVEDLREIESLLTHPRVVALGETGLDFYRDWAPRERQIAFFEESIDLARRYHKKLVIHCRAAEKEILETLASLQAQHGSDIAGVFHCFGGDIHYAREILNLGFLISITGIVTFKSNHPLRECVKYIPLESLMLETDSPYMAPEPERGKPSEPRHVYEIAAKIAEVKGVPHETVGEITTANARRFFGFGTV